MTIINAEAPVALHLETYPNGETVINPLTTCCAASAKGCADCIACRACYQEIDPRFGDCWLADGGDPLAHLGFGGHCDGWDTYRDLVTEELQLRRLQETGHMGVDTYAEDQRKAETVVAEAKRQVAALTEEGHRDHR